MSAPVVAVVGGGQLARMLAESANALGIELKVLVESDHAAAAQVVPKAPVGSPSSREDMTNLVADADVLTFEHEHQDDAILKELCEKISVQPSPQALLYARDKQQMRLRLTKAGIPCPPWQTITSVAQARQFGKEVGFPFILKTARGGYDGKGVKVISNPEEVADWLELDVPIIAEQKIDFETEIAVLVARRPSGEIKAWPVVRTIQAEGVCAEVQYPCGLSPQVQAAAQEIGMRIAQELKVTGVLAVEMFVTQDQVLVNELAMRPHNSGHWTIEACATSQFEQHLRAVLDLPLGDTNAIVPAAVMVNLLGSAYQEPRDKYAQVMSEFPQAKIHYYGKEVRPGRKLGHVSVIGEDVASASRIARAAARILKG